MDTGDEPGSHNPGERMLRVAADRASQAISAELNRRIAARHGARLGLWLVAEYPKSGGTWVGRMLSNYLRLPFPQESRLPIVMPAVLHNHWEYNPHYPSTLYVYRDGRDVMVSLYFHLLAQRGKVAGVGKVSNGPGRSLGAALPDFIVSELKRPSGAPIPWHRHIEGWHRRPAVGKLRYEDLLKDPVVTMRAGLAAAGIEADDERLAEAVDRESFVKVSGGRKPGQEERGSFLRKGVAGDWRNYFTRQAAEVFNARAGPMLEELGYEQDDSWVARCPTLAELFERENQDASQDTRPSKSSPS